MTSQIWFISVYGTTSYRVKALILFLFQAGGEECESVYPGDLCSQRSNICRIKSTSTTSLVTEYWPGQNAGNQLFVKVKIIFSR